MIELTKSYKDQVTRLYKIQRVFTAIKAYNIFYISSINPRFDIDHNRKDIYVYDIIFYINAFYK